MQLSDVSIHAWIREHKIKTEKGDLLNLSSHLFLFDIYSDQAQKLVVMKAAQVGMSTLEVIKNFYDAKRHKMDIIYTLPTDADTNIFVGGKVNRIIAQNPILLEYTKDKDSIEQKQVGNSMIYFRGTWTKKSAIMVTADRLVHDEKDSSKLDVISDYQARLQHSKFKQTHTFSHPSAPDSGVDIDWKNSDMKHWFIKCPHCSVKQYLSWPESIDLEKNEYICKKCKKALSDEDRRIGEWIPKYKDKDFSGYWIPLLVAPWVSAESVIKKYNDPESTEEFFYNKILGLPYLGRGNKLTKDLLLQNLTIETITPDKNERVIMGVDTGLKIDYVLGTDKGLFFHGEAPDYSDLDNHMIRWPKMIVIIDAGGDLIGCRKFQERWKGRVFLCYFGEDRKTQELVRWGEGDNYGTVIADRNRLIQLVVDEFSDKRIALQGTENDWYEYWMDWNNLTRTKILDAVTGQFKSFKWIRNGRDHKALATAYWRIGISKFSEKGDIIGGKVIHTLSSYEVMPGNVAQFNPLDRIENIPMFYDSSDD